MFVAGLVATSKYEANLATTFGAVFGITALIGLLWLVDVPGSLVQYKEYTPIEIVIAKESVLARQHDNIWLHNNTTNIYKAAMNNEPITIRCAISYNRYGMTMRTKCELVKK